MKRQPLLLPLLFFFTFPSCTYNPSIRWPAASTNLETAITNRRPIRLFVYGWTRTRGRVVPMFGLESCTNEVMDLRWAAGVQSSMDQVGIGLMSIFTLGVCPLMARLVNGSAVGVNQPTPYNLRYDRLAKTALEEFYDVNDQSCCHADASSFLKEFSASKEDTAVVVKANTVVSPAWMVYRPVFSKIVGEVSVFRFKKLYVPLIGTNIELYKKLPNGKPKLDANIRRVNTIENWFYQSPYGPYHSLKNSVPVPGRIPKAYKAPGVDVEPGEAEATFMGAFDLFMKLARRNSRYDIFKSSDPVRTDQTRLGVLKFQSKFERDATGKAVVPWGPELFIGNGRSWNRLSPSQTAPGEISLEMDIFSGTYTVVARVYDVMLQFPIEITSGGTTSIGVDFSSKSGKSVIKAEEMKFKLILPSQTFDYDPAEEPSEYPPLAPSFFFIPPPIK